MLNRASAISRPLLKIMKGVDDLLLALGAAPGLRDAEAADEFYLREQHESVIAVGGVEAVGERCERE